MAVNRTQASATVASVGGASFIATGGHTGNFAASVTFAPQFALLGPSTLDPAFSNLTNVSFLNGDLTVTANSNLSRNASARSTGISSTQFNKLFCTFYPLVTGGTVSVGAGTGSLANTSGLGTTLDSVGYFTDGTVKVNGVTLSTIATWTANDVIDMAVDFTADRIWFRKNALTWNNNASNHPETGVGGIDISTLNAGPYYAFVEVGNSGDQFTVDFTGGLNAASEAWVSAVVTNGGTVSGARLKLVDALIDGLQLDGVWQKLDRLWLRAAENSASALTDIVADSLASVVGTPTFTTDRGYTGQDAALPTSYINSNFNPTTAGQLFVQNSGHISMWVVTNTAAVNGGAIMGLQNAGATSTILFDTFTDGNIYAGVNDNVASVALGVPASRAGHWCASRTGAAAEVIYHDAVSFSTPNGASTAPILNAPFLELCYSEAGTAKLGTPNQIAVTTIGSGLTATDVTNLRSRLLTYLTAVGAA